MSRGSLDYLINDVLPIVVIIITIITAIIVLIRSNVTKFKFGSFLIEVNAEGKRPNLQEEVKAAKESDSLTPGEKQLLLLERYHGQVISQSNISFWFSLIFAVIGFLVIISSVYGAKDAASIKIIGGTIVDAVSALLFVQSNRARDSLRDFFDKLRADRRLEESLKLLESLQSLELKDRLKSIVVMEFIETKEADKKLAQLLDNANNE